MTLKLNGYSTAQFGKCHEVPPWQTSPVGPFDAWPSGGGGFEHFYGFIGGENNQYYPALYDGFAPVEPEKSPEEGYHLTEDLADRAIDWVRTQKALAPDKPFFWPGRGPGHLCLDRVTAAATKPGRGGRDELNELAAALGDDPPLRSPAVLAGRASGWFETVNGHEQPPALAHGPFDAVVHRRQPRILRTSFPAKRLQGVHGGARHRVVLVAARDTCAVHPRRVCLGQAPGTPRALIAS